MEARRLGSRAPAPESILWGIPQSSHSFRPPVHIGCGPVSADSVGAGGENGPHGAAMPRASWPATRPTMRRSDQPSRPGAVSSRTGPPIRRQLQEQRSMARRSAPPETDEPFEERIVEIDVTEEMSNSYLEYSYSVIYSRALPDARDGLKPVHRRVLYQMGEMGLRPDRGFVKSARVVGEVMGRLHPHGDASIYDTLVRMAQPFSMRLPLVDGHGNFGSLGNDDPPAAMRYTECRLSPAAMLMVATIDEDTVDFAP